MDKYVPVFCCETSRDKAFKLLREKFPDLAMKTTGGWAGKKGIEIKATKKVWPEVRSFIDAKLESSLDHFVCAN